MPKIIDYINKEGESVTIPDCTRNDLPEFFKDMGYKVGVEIGCFRGSFTSLFCRVGLKMYTIDPWSAYGEYRGRVSERKLQEKLDSFYEVAKERLEPYENCTIIKKKSSDALNDFEDESLDFIYIDGNHCLKYVIEDICDWSKKIRKGGVVSGHDYESLVGDRSLHVKHAVNAYVKCYNIKKLYIIGEKHSPKQIGRDRCRSWMWIKE